MTSKKKPVFNLDKDEKSLSVSFEQGEWKSVKNLNKEKVKAQKASANYLSKGARINIRISEVDLQQIKQKAAHEGLPYQTLIASVLHKYAAGHAMRA
jgi:predicted DNA binding CopG/RHH family protein